MYEFHPYYTNDGSVGLYNTDYDDIYHSASGALTEAYEKFILPVNFDKLLTKKNIKVLDICYGIGYNTKSFLNFILEKKILKNYSQKFCKKNISYNYNIAAIHTNNNLLKKLSEIHNSFINSKDCSDSIYTDKINDDFLPKIYIKAVDNDKILSYLSPFVKTGENEIKNNNFNFKSEKINKYLKSDKYIQHKKIDNLINFLILEKIIQNCPEIFENRNFNQILNSKEYNRYFDSKFKGIFKFYRNNIYKLSQKCDKQPYLHNIYYRYISSCYKNRLKTYNLQDVIFDIKNDDARKIILEDNNMYDIIFLDAFTPSKCPCLWSYEFFIELYKHLENDGMILTYSTSSAVRSAMLEAGFNIGNIYNAREKKYTGTIAVKNKSHIKYPLSEYDLGLLKTKAGIFYRDENLTGLNEAIINSRNIEIQNSNRITSSKYKKLYKEEKCTTM